MFSIMEASCLCHSWPGDDGDLRSRLRGIALERRRFGYRRSGIMLAREGIVMNHKKLRRL